MWLKKDVFISNGKLQINVFWLFMSRWSGSSSREVVEREKMTRSLSLLSCELSLSLKEDPGRIKENIFTRHCIQYARIQVLFYPYFPVYRILSIYDKIWLRENPYSAIFYTVRLSWILHKKWSFSRSNYLVGVRK